MADTIIITPPYPYSLTEQLKGTSGRVTTLKADKPSGRLDIALGSFADPGAPLTTKTMALAGLGAIIDTPPGQTLDVQVDLLTTLTSLTIRTHEADVETSGHTVLIVVELDQNGRATAVPIVQVREQWNLRARGRAAMNFRRPATIKGTTQVNFGHLYLMWALAFTSVEVIEDPPGAQTPADDIGFVGFDALVRSFTATAS